MKNLGNVFILGDSYSTFEGYNPEGYDVWYNNEAKDCNDLCRVEDCWWYRFFEKAPATLVRNCSYWISKNNGYMKNRSYTFDVNGMITDPQPIG